MVVPLRSELSGNGENMSFTDWYVRRGRITRRVFWLHYMLVVVGLSVLATVADASMGYPALAPPADPSGVYDYVGGPASLFVALFTLVPCITASVTRLHDRGHTAWRLLWCLVPIVGSIVLLVENGFLRGDGGPNRYGPAPGRPVGNPIPV